MNKIDQNIIFENEHFVAVDKPSGLLTITDRQGKEESLKDLLLKKYGAIYTVHRLDRDTSGLIIFARNEEAHKTLSMLFQSRDIEKYYGGLVMGKITPPEGTVDAPIMEHPVKKGAMVINRRGKPSVTDYVTLESFKLYSWVQFRIHTGRTHQIRVHAKHLGHPVVYDEVYGDGQPVLLSSLKKKFNLAKDELEERPLLARLALHSWKLKFELGGETYNLEAPLPKTFKAVLQQLRKNSMA